MKRYLITALLLLTPLLHAQTCDNPCAQYRQFARAIAKAEGYYVKGSLSARNKNPGNIKSVHGYKFDGQIGVDKHGHVIFRNDNKGWAALQNQVRLMCGTQGVYSADMTIQQIGKHYAKNWKLWSKNVARNMNCTPKTTLAELFEIPPVINMQLNSHALEGTVP
jgi:hypothetical protein